jgi:DNA-binding CsgD family transcriptional regulator
MDQPVDEQGRRRRLERIVSAFQNGLVLVDETGAVVWMDETTQRRVNGELQNLALPVAKGDHEAIDCFISPVELTVNGERLALGVIQAVEARPGADLIAAIESVVADSTSWFTRTIVEKLKAVGQAKPEGSTPNGMVQLDALSAREREVLGLICEGHSDVQMAKLLSLSENTVRNHIAALYRKIGVNRRTAAVIWARERGITCRDDLQPMRRLRGNGHRGNGHGGNGHGGNGRGGSGHDSGGSGHDSGGTPPY